MRIAPVHRLRLLAGILLAAFLLQPAAVGASTGDAPLPHGHFYTEAGGGTGFGFPIVDATGGDFWSSFQALGGTDALGYPASMPYQSGGFTYQAVQGALLQWRPDLNRAVLANTFEQFSNAGLDSVLLQQRQIPLPVADDGSGGNYQQAVTIRLTWLTDPGIAQRFYANPNPGSVKTWSRDDAIQLYGLPMSQPEAFGPFVSQRFQRITFQRWTEQVAGMPPPGTVDRVLGGDLAKEEGLVPLAAQTPQTATGVAASSAPTAVPDTGMSDITVPTGVPAPTPQPTPANGAIAGIQAATGPNQFPLYPCRASAVDPHADQNVLATPAPEAGRYLAYGNTPVKIEHNSNCWSPTQLQLMHNQRTSADVTDVVIHWTDLDYARSVYALQRGVSVHWLVPLSANGSQPVLEMIDPRNAAWHAGPLNAGVWEDAAHLLCIPGSPCRPNGNVHSLGFENVGKSTPNSYQVGVMTDIIAALIQEGYPIKLDRQHIVGHKEINRQKSDPGNLDINQVIALVLEKLKAAAPAPVPLPVVNPTPAPTPAGVPADGSSTQPFTLQGSASGQLVGNSGGAFTYYTIPEPTGAPITLHFSYTGINAAAGAVGVSVFQGLSNLGTLSPGGGQSGATLVIHPAAGAEISVQVFSYVPQTVNWQLGVG
ncbi:MAG: N-acetylmuramoyl-L-alanine amidase [Chloroflexota bacterium]